MAERPPGESSGDDPAADSGEPRDRATGSAAGEARPARREGRLTRHARHVRQVWEDPRSLGDILRGGLIDIWCSRGAGFFGLGYLLTFVLLEVRLVVGEFESSAGVIEFITDQLLEYLLRLGVMSFVNVFLAFLWPLLLLEYLGGWGLVVLPLAYLLFERVLRPGIEASIPELEEARRHREERKAAKRVKRQRRAKDGRKRL